MPQPSDTTNTSAAAKVLAADDSQEDSDAAVALIRSKINALYDGEPDAAEEAAEVAQLPPAQLSPHQRYMQELSSSGKSEREVQAAWHQYYMSLSDTEKHKVWSEFYDQQNRPEPIAQPKPPSVPEGTTVQSGGAAIIKPDRKNLRLSEKDEVNEGEAEEEQAPLTPSHHKRPTVISPQPSAPIEAYSQTNQKEDEPATVELPALAAAAEALGGSLHDEPRSSEPETSLPAPISHTRQHSPGSDQSLNQPAVLPPAQAKHISADHLDEREPQQIRQDILSRVEDRASSTTKSNLKSLMFGLGMGGLVLLVTTFGFFNERFIAPLITPSRALSSTPLILDDSVAVGEESRIIIPKINVEVPLVFDAPSIEEDVIQEALEEGIVHYPTTPLPGEVGNTVLFGHSSNNILNRGQFKFAFVLLNRLENGDTFFIEHEGVRYTYRIFESRIVPPTEISVLDPHPEKDSVASLITCDPPGTAINRLVVVGEQISPDPAGNQLSDTPPPSSAPQPEILPSDAPTLWQRLFGN